MPTTPTHHKTTQNTQPPTQPPNPLHTYQTVLYQIHKKSRKQEITNPTTKPSPGNTAKSRYANHSTTTEQNEPPNPKNPNPQENHYATNQSNQPNLRNPTQTITTHTATRNLIQHHIKTRHEKAIIDQEIKSRLEHKTAKPTQATSKAP